MERFRLFRFQRLQFLLLAKFARDFAERWLPRVRVKTLGRFLCRRGTAIIFLRALVSFRFDGGAVFRSQNVPVLEIFFGVNVLGAFSRFLFARVFLTSGGGDAGILLVLRARDGGAECRAGQNQNCGDDEPVGMRETAGKQNSPLAWATRLERHLTVRGSQQHGQTDYGGTPRNKKYIREARKRGKLFPPGCLGVNAQNGLLGWTIRPFSPPRGAKSVALCGIWSLAQSRTPA